MRSTGTLTSPRNLSPGDHACWAYEEDGVFVRDAASFLGDGLSRGERIWFIGERHVDGFREAMAGIAEVDRLVNSGALVLGGVDGAYATGRPVTPIEQVRRYDEATARAIDDGFTGLRVAADATLLVAHPELLDAFSEYEHLIDRYMVEHPFTALCAYDRRVLGLTVEELACIHPISNIDTTSFNLSAGPSGSLRLAGEIDTFSARLLTQALRAAAKRSPSTLRIDARDLSFIDHNALMAMSRSAERLELITCFTAAQALVELLDLSNVHVTLEEAS